MKPMRQSGRREYDAARLHRTVLVANPNHGSAADDVVDLLLLVRLLRIDAASRQDIQAEAERRHTEEFKIGLAGLHALPVEVGEFEGVHRVATLTDRTSRSQGSRSSARPAARSRPEFVNTVHLDLWRRRERRRLSKGSHD